MYVVVVVSLDFADALALELAPTATREVAFARAELLRVALASLTTSL